MRQPYRAIGKNVLGQFPEDDMSYPALQPWQTQPPMGDTNNRGAGAGAFRGVVVVPRQQLSAGPETGRTLSAHRSPFTSTATKDGSNEEQPLPSTARNPGRLPVSVPSDPDGEMRGAGGLKVSAPLGVDGLRVLYWRGSDPQIREQIRTAKPGHYTYAMEDGRVTAFAPFTEENPEEWIGGRDAGNRVQQAGLLGPLTDAALNKMAKWATKKLGNTLLEEIRKATSPMSPEKIVAEIVDKEIAGLDPEKDWRRIDELQNLKRHIEKEGLPDELDAIGRALSDVLPPVGRKDDRAPSRSSEPTAGEPRGSNPRTDPTGRSEQRRPKAK